MLNKEQTCEGIQAGRYILETVKAFISSRLVKTAPGESSGDFFFTKKRVSEASIGSVLQKNSYECLVFNTPRRSL